MLTIITIFLYYNSYITKKPCLIKSYILTAVVQKKLSARLFQTQKSEIIFAVSIPRVFVCMSVLLALSI